MKNNNRPKNKRALETVAEYFELPAEIAAGDARITLTGQRRLLIENHRGIVEYTDDRICVDCRGFCAAVIGHGLSLAAMNPRELVITGDIHGLQLGGAEGGARA